MKAEFIIDTQEMVEEVTRGVVKALKPYLKDKPNAELLFTVKTLAGYLGVTKQWVYKKVEHNEIPCIKKGNFLRFRKSAIDQWLNEDNIPALEPPPRHLKMLK